MQAPHFLISVQAYMNSKTGFFTFMIRSIWFAETIKGNNILRRLLREERQKID
jgi:hypothetical protein